jgi:glutathione S-transferase
MITLYGFGPAFGLPDPSPFVLKTDIQLKMAGLPYRHAKAAPQAAPKGKIPFIDDDGVLIGDSTFIRAHIEARYGVDLDRGLSGPERAQAWAVERMLEDHLYWAIIALRWGDDENFARGPSHFFDGIPEEMRETIRKQARERALANLHGHGLGRHSKDELAELAGRSLAATSVLLGDKPFLFGATPTGTDATAFGMIAGALAPLFEGALPRMARAHDNLVAYGERMMDRFYPDFAAAA